MVKRFLALHKNLFPIKALRDIDHDRVGEKYSARPIISYMPKAWSERPLREKKMLFRGKLLLQADVPTVSPGAVGGKRVDFKITFVVYKYEFSSDGFVSSKANKRD